MICKAARVPLKDRSLMATAPRLNGDRCNIGEGGSFAAFFPSLMCV